MIGQNIDKAKSLLKRGEVIGFPTETVYGLAANAYNETAVKAIFTIKGRPHTSPLIVHTSDLARVRSFVKCIPAQAMLLAETFWPGPLTLLLEKLPSISDTVTAGLPTVGIRIPRHPLSLKLLEAISFPVAAPSANPFGYISPTTAEHVEEQLGSQIPYILDGGPCQAGLESTIVGFQHEKAVIYRLGSITQEELEDVIGPLSYVHPTDEKKGAFLAPGRTKHHYAPRTPMRVGDLSTLVAQHAGQRVVALCFDKPIDSLSLAEQVILSPKKSLQEAAKSLFAGLHQLDKLGADVIIAPVFPEEGLGRVINERLKRASSVG